MKIGVFDSGLGGLAILREILKKLPQYDYVYLGDNARVPYGDRSATAIYQYTVQAVDFLARQSCSLIILACNTASATALRKIQREYLPKHHPNLKVLGVIRPTAEKAAATVHRGGVHRIGVIGTRATISTYAFTKELKKLARMYTAPVYITEKATPLLVPLIEEGEIKGTELSRVLSNYLSPLKKARIDSLILGCTHYSLIKSQIQNVVGPKVKIISEGGVVAIKLKDYLNHHPEIEKKLSKSSRREYYITDLNDRYLSLAKLFLGQGLRQKDKLKLAQL